MDGGRMKIVTYNVNSLRQRVTQFGSLLRLLNSLQADIVCFQETKLSRQELAADLTTAEGYEAFFSCTRTSDKGRVRYSGVATFCRIKSAFSSTEAALSLAAEEGVTGLLEHCGQVPIFSGIGPIEMDLDIEGVETLTRDELLKVDNEGRCIITDHGHFVLFNLYGPRAEPDDKERIRFKLVFFKVLQRRWETLLNQGKSVVVVGDLNIAPFAVDRAGAGSDFEENVFRKWLRSLLVENGGYFFDAFRSMHPLRQDAYTCWSANTGAEEFNHGSRIDHILIGGSCFHDSNDANDHSILRCNVRECDILTDFKRSKQDNLPRWKGGRTVRLEGSDHVPVFVCFEGVPDLPVLSVPSFAVRYFPEVRGRQQTLVSLLVKKAYAAKIDGESSSMPCESLSLESSSEDVNLSSQGSGVLSGVEPLSPQIKTYSSSATNTKRTKHGHGSQTTLTSFFQRNVPCTNDTIPVKAVTIKENSIPFKLSEGTLENIGENSEVCEASLDESNIHVTPSSQEETERGNGASDEWLRIRQLMQKSLPLCHGHGEPCVSRFVKKAGPTMGRDFMSARVLRGQRAIRKLAATTFSGHHPDLRGKKMNVVASMKCFYLTV